MPTLLEQLADDDQFEYRENLKLILEAASAFEILSMKKSIQKYEVKEFTSFALTDQEYVSS